RGGVLVGDEARERAALAPVVRRLGGVLDRLPHLSGRRATALLVGSAHVGETLGIGDAQLDAERPRREQVVAAEDAAGLRLVRGRSRRGAVLDLAEVLRVVGDGDEVERPLEAD